MEAAAAAAEARCAERAARAYEADAALLRQLRIALREARARPHRERAAACLRDGTHACFAPSMFAPGSPFHATSAPRPGSSYSMCSA